MLIQIGSSWPTERPGGVPTYYRSFVRGLASQVGSHRVVGLVAGGPRVTEESGGLVHAFAPLEVSKYTRWMWIARGIRKYFRAGSIICCHYLPHVLAVLHRLHPANFVFHFHGPAALEAEVEGKSGVYCRVIRALERRAYARAGYITTLSHAFKRTLVEHYGVPEQKVHVIPGGIEARQYPLKRPAGPGTPLRLFTARRLVARMGVDVLLQALALLPRPWPVRLRVAGEGPLRPRLDELVLRHGLQDAVTLLGRVSEEQLRQEYAEADLTVVPTRQLEGFGLVLLESLASGTPAVGTRIGGIPEILHPLSPRLLIDSCTPEAIAAKLQDCASGRIPLPPSATCRSYVEDRYSWPRVVAAHVELYERHFGGVRAWRFSPPQGAAGPSRKARFVAPAN